MRVPTWLVPSVAALAVLLSLPDRAGAAEKGEELLAASFARERPGMLALSRRGDTLAVAVEDYKDLPHALFKVWVYDLASGKRTHQIALKYFPRFLGYRLDGKLVTCVSGNGGGDDYRLVQLWDRAGKEASQFNLPMSATRTHMDVCFLSPCGEQAVSHRDGGLDVYDTGSGKRLGRLPLKGKAVGTNPAWSADSKRLAVVDKDSRMAVFDMRAFGELAGYDVLTDPDRPSLVDFRTMIAFAPRGNDLITLSGDYRAFRRYDALTGKLKVTTQVDPLYRVRNPSIFGARWLSDGRTVIAGDGRYGFALFDLHTGTPLTPGRIAPIDITPQWLAVSRDERVVAWSGTRAFRVWRLANGRPEEP